MSILSLPSVDHREALVALALLRIGADTKTARVVKEVCSSRRGPDPTGPGAFETVCAALDIPPTERAAKVAQAFRDARRAMDRTQAARQTMLTLADPTYPDLLRAIPDPPIVLWARGHPEMLNRAAVAIVGSRRASAAGVAMATRLGREVSRAGLGVVSGLARGIDGAAHRGALEADDGWTIAVLGSGVDVVYPAEHRALTETIATDGLLLSEFPPGTPPFPNHFPLRNRIISGLSQAVVVVEASERSGSLITARAALEQGRDVLAVPGPVAGGVHRGCHALIKDGARLVESVEDILEEIRWRRPAIPSSGGNVKGLPISELEQVMGTGEVLTLDDLAVRSGRPASQLLAELGRLELAGRIARMAGGTFARLD